MKIAVLCGGLSTERKISLSSGTRVCEALRNRGHQAVLVDLFLGVEAMEEATAARAASDPAALFEDLPELEPVVFDGKAPDLRALRASRRWKSPSLFGPGVLEICQAADIVFVALHGMNGEDGRVQATFDMLGIPYTGSGYLGAALAMDKTLTKRYLKPFGVHMPAGRVYRVMEEDPEAREQALQEIAAASQLPCVVKTPTGGSSVGVYIVRDRDDLLPALRDCLRYGADILVEDYIEGREFTCAVLLDRALPSVEIVPLTRFYDYENKYRAGATEEICPGRCTPEVEEEMGCMALLAHRSLGLRTYSRSDFIVDDQGGVWYLETNTLPGMTPTSLVPQEAAAVGISYGELCEMIVEDGLKNCRQNG